MTTHPGRSFYLFFIPCAMAVLCLAGCAVGPSYVAPEKKVPDSWTSPLEEGIQCATTDERFLSTWWEAFQDPVLSRLVKWSLEAHPDLHTARSKVRQARAARRMSRAALFPTADGTGSYARSRSRAGVVSELFTAGLDSSWELDLFGGARRSVEAAEADEQAAQEDLRDVQVSMAAEVALAYMEVRTLQNRLAILERDLETREALHRLTTQRRLAGLATELEVQQSLYDLEGVRAQIPELKADLESAKDSLAVLVGRPPGSLHTLLESLEAIPRAPAQVAVGIPADLLRRRPDIRRAERELAAQTARVGEAVADLYPKLTLKGSLGLESLTAGDLLDMGNRIFSLGPSVSLPVFRAGELRAAVEVQTELQRQALSTYEATVLNALKEVEEALSAYVQGRKRKRFLENGVLAARHAAELARAGYAAGQNDYSDVLEAGRALLSLQDQLAASEGEEASNLVRLFKALGGGWEYPEAATRDAARGKE